MALKNTVTLYMAYFETSGTPIQLKRWNPLHMEAHMGELNAINIKIYQFLFCIYN